MSNSNVLLRKAACVLEALRGFFKTFVFSAMETSIIKKKHVFFLVVSPSDYLKSQ